MTFMDWEGGGKVYLKLYYLRKGGWQNFRHFEKGGENFGLPLKGGGSNNFRLDQIFFYQMFLKHNFSCFGVFWALFIFCFEGEPKNFRCVAKGGGQKFSDASSRRV